MYTTGQITSLDVFAGNISFAEIITGDLRISRHSIWSLKYCLRYDSKQQLLTYSMEQSPSWEVDSSSASQEIPRILWNPKVLYRIHKTEPSSITLARSFQSITLHPPSWRSILILSSHLCLGLQSGLFPSGLPTKTLFGLLLSPHVPHAPPISFFSISLPE